jgi:DNA-binding HxlR family transcriptional regulator
LDYPSKLVALVLVARRTYDQYCPLAISLDVIGDRWAPLVVRELLLGSRRYTDLARGLPGIATDMLTRRLRELEQAGVVTRRVLPPPAATTVYALTERGERLREPLMALARWGLELLPPPAEGVEFTPTMLASALQVVLQPGPRDRLVLALVIGGEEFAVHVHAGSARVERGLPESAELTLRGDPGPLVAAVTGDESHPTDVDLEGDRGALNRLRSMVLLPADAGSNTADSGGHPRLPPSYEAAP